MFCGIEHREISREREEREGGKEGGEGGREGRRGYSVAACVQK